MFTEYARDRMGNFHFNAKKGSNQNTNEWDKTMWEW